MTTSAAAAAAAAAAVGEAASNGDADGALMPPPTPRFPSASTSTRPDSAANTTNSVIGKKRPFAELTKVKPPPPSAAAAASMEPPRTRTCPRTTTSCGREGAELEGADRAGLLLLGASGSGSGSSGSAGLPSTTASGASPPTTSRSNSSADVSDDQDDGSSLDDSYYEIPKATFSDIIGHGQAKLRLDEALLPLALPPDLVDSVLTGVRAAPATVLLHGPPGCGKTQLARAVAGESSSPLITVGPSDVLSKFVGESERSIRELFQRARAEAARSESRCAVLFFDEIDAIGGARSGMANGSGGGGGGGSVGAAAGGGVLGIGSTTTVGGGEGDGGSSRRVLAELLIQLTRNFNEAVDEEDGEEMECDEGVVVEDYEENANANANGSGVHGTVHERGEGFNQPDRGPRAISPLPLPQARSMDGMADVASQHHHQQQQQRFHHHHHHHHHQQQQQQQQLRTEHVQKRKPRTRVIVVAATNRPEDCDPALLRRFAVRVYVGPPTCKDRKRILSKFLADVEHKVGPEQLHDIAGATEGWSGSELESLSREAIMAPVRDCLRAAALLRAQARKKEQQSGADSGQDSRKPASQFEVGRDALIGGFRSLRAVELRDFESAMAFCLSGDSSLTYAQGGPFAFGRGMSGGHYDSDSSSDEEDVST